MTPEPNPLLDYTTYTYSLKLYGITKEDFNNVVNEVNLDRIHKQKMNKKVVIAESAATSMIINELRIKSTPASTEGSYINEISFDILQMKGYSLVESIVMASKICGWESMIHDPVFILEINFKGYKNVIEPELDIYTISLPIKFSSVSTTVSSNGTTYNVTAVLNYEQQRPDISTIPEKISVTKKHRFGDFISEFKTKLNNKIKEDMQQEDGVIEAHEHDFVIDDEPLSGDNIPLREFEISKPNNSESPIYNASLDNEGENGFTEYRFPNGTSIPKALESVIATSTRAQKLLNPDKNDGIGIMFRIQPIVEIKKFNKATGSNSLKVTWHITHQKVPIPTKNNLNEREYLNHLLSIGVLRKVYNYYFTGENVDVTNVNIDMKHIYFNKLSKYNNLFINQSRNIPSLRVVPTEPSLEKAVQEKINNNENHVAPDKIENTGSEIYYVDNITNITFETEKYYNKFIKQFSSSTSSEGSAPEEGANSKRFDYYLTLHNIRNSTKNSMITMEMEIRGDPYWLKPAHTVYNETTFGKDSRKTFNLLAFFMGYPNEIQENNDNSVSYRTDYMFSGLYTVISVVSNFNGGKFSQQLECTRISDISGYVVEDELNNSN
ncbi:hypothetical protein PBI_SCTP2_188 [Salicola phage SCTP-2]|nr:hypothetical protein PBI_SCTP2_188 [Salicola phage SCTP-2]